MRRPGQSEMGQRATRWFEPATAASLVIEGDLAELISGLPKKLKGRRAPRLSERRLRRDLAAPPQLRQPRQATPPR